MRIRLLSLLPLLAFALWAPEATGQPVKFFGQDAPSSPTFNLTNGAALAAYNDFVSNFTSISNTSFEGNTAIDPNDLPARNASAPFAELAGVAFASSDANDVIPAVVSATTGGILDRTTFTVANAGATTNYVGTYPVQGSKYLYSVGYALPDGTTSGGVRIDYRPDLITDGSGTRPFNAFGVFVTDAETYGTITMTLTPLGGGTPTVLDYNGLINQGTAGTTPGNGQVAFVGFIDQETAYERIDINFTKPSGAEADEAFGFDFFVLGEAGQIATTQRTVAAVDIVDEPGWRLLSAPVNGLTVDKLAQQNLVQGVAAGDGAPQQQYPETGSNFYIGYGGGTRWDYIPVSTTGTQLEPGRGFWWYWYDRDINPDNDVLGGGTSESVQLDDFYLTTIGTPITDATTSRQFDDNTNCASDEIACIPPFTTPNGNPEEAGAPAGTVTPADDDFYMIGNPYPEPFDVASITATGGTLQDAMYMWNPSRQDGTPPRTGEDTSLDGPGSYEVVFQTPPDGNPDYIAVWQGMLAEVSKTVAEAGSPVTFTYDITGSVSGETPPFYGITANQSTAPERYVKFTLDGVMASGAATWDAATYVRFRNDATDDWDRYDASKPSAPAGGAALSAIGKRDGKESTQGVLSLSADLPDSGRWAQAIVRLAFSATEAGTYTLEWDGNHGPMKLRDLEAGVVVRLDQEESYTFEAEAGDWNKRFMLVFGPHETEMSADGASALSTVEAVTVIGTPSPNPTTDAFALDVRTAAAADATVSLYDALGRRVSEQTISATEAQAGTSVIIPTGALAPGAYIVVVEAPDVRETRRVTVLR